MRKIKKRYLVLGIVGFLVATFVAVVQTGAIKHPLAWVEIGPSQLTSWWALETTRPEGSPPIVTKTVDGVTGPYMEFNSNGE